MIIEEKAKDEEEEGGRGGGGGEKESGIRKKDKEMKGSGIVSRFLMATIHKFTDQLVNVIKLI